MKTLQSNTPKEVDLGIDTIDARESDLISLDEAARLFRGRKGGHCNVDVMRRYSNPRKGRLFAIGSETFRLVLPTTARGTARVTTAAWVDAWKRKFAELAELALRDGPGDGAAAMRTTAQEKRSHQRALKNLAKHGMKSARKKIA